MDRLKVWSVCNGTKYTDDDVRLLRSQVTRHLSQPHTFCCLSDRPIDGVQCLIPTEQWPGWWAKLSLFRYARTGMHLYCDLDCVVVGALDGLISAQLAMPANWGQSGHGGCQSSVMAWGRDYAQIAEAFDMGQLHKPENGNCGAYGARHRWGDQEFITDLLGDPGKGQVVAMRGIYSYKYHAQYGLPEDARVIAFHGSPKPSEVADAWVRAARSTVTLI